MIDLEIDALQELLAAMGAKENSSRFSARFLNIPKKLWRCSRAPRRTPTTAATAATTSALAAAAAAAAAAATPTAAPTAAWPKCGV